jgi:hypothetical protein
MLVAVTRAILFKLSDNSIQLNKDNEKATMSHIIEIEQAIAHVEVAVSRTHTMLHNHG